MPTPTVPTDVTFWYDPRCPWAWVTSRWMVELESQGLVHVRWQVMSLANLHEHDADYDATKFEIVRTSARAAAAAASVKGDEILGDVYTALGRRIHVEKQTPDRDLVTAVFDELGLPLDLVDKVFTTQYDDYIRASHDAAVEAAGHDLGTPVIAYDGKAFFGPVLKAALTGDDASKLWDAMKLIAELDGVYEIKRSRPEGPIV